MAPDKEMCREGLFVVSEQPKRNIADKIYFTVAKINCAPVVKYLIKGAKQEELNPGKLNNNTTRFRKNKLFYLTNKTHR